MECKVTPAINIPNSQNHGKVLRIKDLWGCQKHCAERRAKFFSYWDDGPLHSRWCACKKSDFGKQWKHGTFESVIKSGKAEGCDAYLRRPSLKLYGVSQAPGWMVCGTQKCEACWGAQKCSSVTWVTTRGLDRDKDKDDLLKCPKGYRHFEDIHYHGGVYLRKCRLEA